MMKITHTNILDTHHKKQVDQLMVQCREVEPLSVTFPLEDGLEYFLHSQDGQLSAALALFFPAVDCCECIALTAPAHRQQGIFTQLLEAALCYLDRYEEQHQRETAFYFLCDGITPSALQVLDSLAADYSYSEYIMAYNISQQPAINLDLASVKITTSQELFWYHQNNVEIGSCRIIPYGQTAYLYDFEIHPKYRGQGHSHLFLQQLFLELKAQNMIEIFLQVSSLNNIAFSLYKKTGFQITETLSYYQYL